MADYTESQLRAELQAALAVLAPQIRGLNDLSKTSISTELLNQIDEQITNRVRRQSLIQAVLNGLDAVDGELSALENDGYPDLLPWRFLARCSLNCRKRIVTWLPGLPCSHLNRSRRVQ